MTVGEKIYQLLPGYLAWLNLRWEPEGFDHHIAQLNRASAFLASDVRLWAAAIRDQNWRSSLVGSACVLATRNRSLLDDLACRFYDGSFVAPQIAVAIGMIHPLEARTILSDRLDALKSDPKRFVAAQTVLARIGHLTESEIALTGWSELDQDEAEIGHAVVCGHWDFWTAIR